MHKHLITGAAVCAMLAGTSAAALAANGPMAFEPISGSAYGEQSDAGWDVPLVAPEGFTQDKVSDETDLDLYAGADDLSDMNTVNETGPQAGRYLYRTHEVGSNGAVVVVDLRTGQEKVLVQRSDWSRVDGIRWTPWGTLLVGEERPGGVVSEIFLDPADPTSVDRVEQRKQIGVQRHEGVGVGKDGSVYVIDELNGGSIFRFVPSRRGDLSEGQLYALKLTGLEDADQKWSSATYADKVGDFTWVPLDMDQVVVDADAAANDVNATEFGRPEDVELIGNKLYVANTSEDRVVQIDLAKEVLSSYVLAGDNAPVEDEAAGQTGFHSPDNLAQGPDGRLWIVEDNSHSDIWVARKDADGDGAAEGVELFASLRDPGAEISGIYFGKDPKTLFFNVQHPEKALADGTWTVTGR